MDRKHFQRLTYYLEHFIFPVVFILFAAMMANAFIDGLRTSGTLDMVRISRQARYGFLFFFNILIAYFLSAFVRIPRLLVP